MRPSLLIVTPAGPRSKSGNRTTAVRWQHLLEELGATVNVATSCAISHSREPSARPRRNRGLDPGEPGDGAGSQQRIDALIALHAYHSAASVHAFRREHPGAPVIVALTGTDINEYLRSHRTETLATIEAADALVCLHDAVAPLLPAEAQRKLHVIHQSAQAPTGQRCPAKRTFHVCVVGHLREVKDSLRTAYAVRHLPDASRILVTHYGAATDEAWSTAATAEASANPRYGWLGARPQWRVRREFQRTRAMVLSSRSEGGANVIGEALVAGVPILASRISGNIGLLGPDYAGYFEVGATDQLRALLLRIESDPVFLAVLERQCARRAPLFSRSQERARWQALLQSLPRWPAQPPTP